MGIGVVELVLAIVTMGLAISLLAIAAPIIIVMAIVRALSGGARRSRYCSADEARMVQEIYQGLAGMEKRLSNVETIVLEQSRRRDGSATRTDL